MSMYPSSALLEHLLVLKEETEARRRLMFRRHDPFTSPGITGSGLVRPVARRYVLETCSFSPLAVCPAV